MIVEEEEEEEGYTNAIIDDFFSYDYLHSEFDKDGIEKVKTGTSDILRVNLKAIIDQLIRFKMTQEEMIGKVRNKFFLFAHHMWLNNHMDKLFSIKSLIDSVDANNFMTTRRAYTLTRLPKYFVFNIEFGEYFNYCGIGEEAGEMDFRRYFCYILPHRFDISLCMDIEDGDGDLQMSFTHSVNMSHRSQRSNSVILDRRMVTLHR